MHGASSGEIVRSDTSKPSMRSSPWMRGAPQSGIFNDHLEDQVTDLFGNSFPADLPSHFAETWPNTIGIRPDASGRRFLVRPKEARLSI